MDGKSPKLEAIRSTKRIEPQNTGANHPTVIYMPVGHGGESVGERHVVPKGCILVVKSHSGDTTMNTDFIENAKAVLNIENKDTVFDPVSHKKELFSLLTSKRQANHNDITSSNSVAIYREGDTYNNFRYQLVNKFPNDFGTSGIFKLYNSTNTNFREIDKSVPVKYDAKVFIKDASDNYIYNPDIIKLDIPSFFSNSDTYEYYYTKQHIQDILDIVLQYINLHKNGYFKGIQSEKKLVDTLGKRYLNVKKGYTYVPDMFDNECPINVIIMLGMSPEDFASVKTEEITKFEAGEIKDDPRNKWVTNLRDMTLKRLCTIIIYITNTTQADLFKDVEAGLIKPGIFYNLICRATGHTSHDKSAERMDGILNKKYIENSDKTIKVKNQAGEIKNRISEAILQRKNQAKQVFNNKAKSISNYSSTIDEGYFEKIEYYINRMNDTSADTYTTLLDLERVNRDIKLDAFKMLVGLSDHANKKILSNFYSKNALLSENKKVTEAIANLNKMIDELDANVIKEPTQVISKNHGIKVIDTKIFRAKEEINFLEGKIELNNSIINQIRTSWLSFLKPTEYMPQGSPDKLFFKTLTNNYKKYRNETAKKYKKVNGKWIENLTGGKCSLTKKKKRKHF
jgi:hypothetical protein